MAFDRAHRAACLRGPRRRASDARRRKTATINLAEGQDVTCTFNERSGAGPALTITKDATEASYNAVGQVIHYTIVATNTGNTTLAAVTVTDPNASG